MTVLSTFYILDSDLVVYLLKTTLKTTNHRELEGKNKSGSSPHFRVLASWLPHFAQSDARYIN